MSGVTLDTGALIALERGKGDMSRRLRRMREIGITVTVPAVVLIEWWRSGFGRSHSDFLAPMRIEPTTGRVATAASEALSTIQASAIDAAVMGSAAQRGDVVYTSDVQDVERLREHFRSVRVLSASGRDT
jgi:rRNA-processing protein FCF1